MNINFIVREYEFKLGFKIMILSSLREEKNVKKIVYKNLICSHEILYCMMLRIRVANLKKSHKDKSQ